MKDAFGVEISKAKDRGGIGWSSEDAAGRYDESKRRKNAYVSSSGTNRASNWKRVGRYAGVGAASGGVMGGAIPIMAGDRNPKSALLGAGVGAAAGAGVGALAATGANEVRAHEKAWDESEASGDLRMPGKGERTSEYHGGLIVPKKKYKKAQFKHTVAENQRLRTQIAEKEANVSYIHKSIDGFGVGHDEEVAKGLGMALKPIVGMAKLGAKGGALPSPVRPGSGLAAVHSVGSGLRTAGLGIKSGAQAGAGKVSGFAAAKPKTTLGIAAGGSGAVGVGLGMGAGKRRGY